MIYAKDPLQMALCVCVDGVDHCAEHAAGEQHLVDVAHEAIDL